MGRETAALLLIFAVHLVAAAALVWAMLGAGTRDALRGWWPDDGGDGPDAPGPASPRGPEASGLPLPDAAPPRARLRTEHERLGDRPVRRRRPAHAPEPDPARRAPVVG